MTVYMKDPGKVTYATAQEIPLVGTLCIDFLSLTLRIPEVFHQDVAAEFQKAHDLGWGYKIPKAGYVNNLMLSADFPQDEGNILIQCSPKKTGLNFFRIEFNPSNTDVLSLKARLDDILPGGYDHLMKSGTVTCIDLTFDVSYPDDTDVIAMYPKMKVEKHVGKGGVTEAKYLGAIGSNKLIALYDKTAQITYKNKKIPVGLKKPLPTDKLLRVELRLLETGYTLKEMEAFSNPFKGLTLVAFPGSKSKAYYDPTWTLFLSVCQDKGIPGALAHFDAGDMKEYKKRIDAEGRTDWWNPEDVWSGLPAAMKAITSP